MQTLRFCDPKNSFFTHLQIIRYQRRARLRMSKHTGLNLILDLGQWVMHNGVQSNILERHDIYFVPETEMYTIMNSEKHFINLNTRLCEVCEIW